MSKKIKSFLRKVAKNKEVTSSTLSSFFEKVAAGAFLLAIIPAKFSFFFIAYSFFVSVVCLIVSIEFKED